MECVVGSDQHRCAVQCRPAFDGFNNLSVMLCPGLQGQLQSISSTHFALQVRRTRRVFPGEADCTFAETARGEYHRTPSRMRHRQGHM
ncbi:protein of unknown function [Burkholderia multivorans]